MSRTDAGELARLKLRYTGWSIQRALPSAARPGLTAVELATGRRLRARTVAELDVLLHDDAIRQG